MPQKRTCAVCQSIFYKPPSSLQKTCSWECGKVLRAQNCGRPREGQSLTCEVCGEDFYKPPSHQAKWPGRTCSRKCAAVLRLRGETRDCKQCGKTFYPRPSQTRSGWGHYCSRDCWREMKGRFRTLHGLNYFTPDERKKWRGDHCIRCGATDDLQLDHITPRFAGGLPVKENAQTLCRKCNMHKYWKEDLPAYEASLVPR